jgi:hypothetical protein
VSCNNATSIKTRAVIEEWEVNKADSLINEAILKGAYTTLASAEA